MAKPKTTPAQPEPKSAQPKAEPSQPNAEPSQLVPVGSDADRGTRRELGGLSENMVRDLAKRGELDAVRIGRRIMITRASINAFIERNRVAAS